LNRFRFATGVCTFAGFNVFMEQWQVTINRMPIFPIQFKDIEIV
jgi:hypothetical protein